MFYLTTHNILLLGTTDIAGFFVHHPTGWIIGLHTTAFDIPVVDHWLKRELI